MATGLVHDINNAIAAFPDLIDEINYKYENNRDIREPLANLQKNAMITDKISGRLKEFVFTGAYHPSFENIATLVTNAINLSLPQQPDHITIHKEIADDLPLVQADSMWIELLLKNLLVNAFVAIPNDRDGQVTITAEVNENHLHLQVQDNGTGIPTELQQDVFKFGKSTKGNSLHKMHGVGLFHCQLIAQAHSGTLQLKSDPGEGAIFILSLPLNTSEAHSLQEGLVDA